MILLKLFGVLFLINMFTVGGGYVMLPMLHDVFVDKFHWLTNREFLDAVAIGQLTPGPLTIMNAFIGFKVAGVAGAAVAAAGSYIPSIVIVTYVTRYYLAYKNSKTVSSVFSGIKPAVAGMLAAIALSLGHTSMTEPATIGIGIAGFVLMSFTKIDPSVVIVLAGITGWAIL